MRSQLLRVFGVVLILGSAARTVWAENYGFGGLFKRNVVVERHLLPEVQLSDASIKVVFPSGGGGLDEARFRSQLESYLARGSQHIYLQEQNPQFEIRMTVTSFERPHIEQKTDKNGTTSTPVGSASMVMQLVHRSDGQLIFSTPVSYTVTGSAGSASLTNIKQMWNNASHRQTTDEGVSLELINGLTAMVASHLVLMNEPISMLLAKGPGLDDADKLAEAKRWNEYLEALSTMPAAPNAADDAYRLYDIGVADEALGYATEDPKITLKYLREASVQYSKAAESKGSEKYFVACQERIEQALNRYTALDQRSQKTAQMEAQGKQQVADTAAQKKAGVLDNSDVIKLVQAHVGVAVVLNKVRTAPQVNFDTSTDGLVQLSQAGVPSNLILEMSKRMEPPTAEPAAAKPVAAARRR